MYCSIAFEEKYISRYTIALDFKKSTSTSLSTRESPWVRDSVVYTQIYRVHTSIYEYILCWSSICLYITVYRSIYTDIQCTYEYILVYTRYFVEVACVSISQYIKVYTQIRKVQTSIYEYILYWSSICPYITVYRSIYTHTSFIVKTQ
jgi:hypothetical protein